MIKSIKVKFSRPALLLIFFALFFCLSGCGGSLDTNSGTGTGTGTTTAAPSLTLNVPSSVSLGHPVAVTAELRDADGNLVNNAVVIFAASSGLVTFTPSSASDMTGRISAGIASVVLNAASDSGGAVYITASTSIISGGTTTTVTSAPVGISVGTASVTLGSIALTPSSISAYSTSDVSVPVLIGGSAATIPISVAFSSPCVSAGKATLISPVTSNVSTGIASSTYKDNGCGQNDLITATVGTNTSSAYITVAAPATSNIEFVSAIPSTIGTSTASSSSLQTSSVVKFKVADSSHNGISGVLVDFSVVPDSKPGGLKLSGTSATSDSDGYVTVSLIAGTVPTPVWVVATVHGTTLKSQSNSLSITTGLPTQNFFSLSVSTFNIEGWSYDGVTSSLTIIASDRLGNPVPDGTAVNFISSGAQVKSPCTITSGTCSTTFTSSADRPENGRVTVLAYALGEKSFVDLPPANNVYDTGETFYDIGDPYIDANENFQWDPGETYIPSETSGSSACVAQSLATIHPTSYWNALSKAGTCTGLWGQNYVRRSAVIVLSGSTAYLDTTSVIQGDTCTNSFYLTLTDVNGNPMPAGTTISAENDNIFYKASIFSGGTQVVTQGTASVTFSGSPVANTNVSGGTGIYLTISGGATCDTADSIIKYPAGTVDLVVTTPKGLKTTFTIHVTES